MKEGCKSCETPSVYRQRTAPSRVAISTLSGRADPHLRLRLASSAERRSGKLAFQIVPSTAATCVRQLDGLHIRVCVSSMPLPLSPCRAPREPNVVASRPTDAQTALECPAQKKKKEQRGRGKRQVSGKQREWRTSMRGKNGVHAAVATRDEVTGGRRGAGRGGGGG